MHISCTVKNLTDALHVLIRNIPSQGCLDSFKYVLFEATADGNLFLSVKNWQSELSLRVDADVKKCGRILTPVFTLLDCLQQAPSVEGSMTLCSTTVSLESGKIFSLETEDASEFLRFPYESAVESIFDLHCRELRETLAQITFAAQQSMYSEEIWRCLWVQIGGAGAITFAASDQRRIALRTLVALEGSVLVPSVFQFPASLSLGLRSTLPKEGIVRLRVDQNHTYLYLDAGRLHATVRLHVEWDKTPRSLGNRIEYTAIPFLRFFPSQYVSIMLLPRVKWKDVLRRREMQHCQLLEREGQYFLEVQRYLKGQKRGEKITLPSVGFGHIPMSFWIEDENLLDVLSSPGASKEMVLAVEDALLPKLLVRWISAGEVRQDYAYVIRVRDPYLALLETKRGAPLSEGTQQILERQKRERASLRENWLVKAIREAVFARIVLLFEHVGVPTEADIRRIVREPERLGDFFEECGRWHDKRDRDRRFDQLVTHTAIQAFTPGGITLRKLSFGEELFLDAWDIVPHVE